jgi:hypothetical protein
MKWIQSPSLYILRSYTALIEKVIILTSEILRCSEMKDYFIFVTKDYNFRDH